MSNISPVNEGEEEEEEEDGEEVFAPPNEAVADAEAANLELNASAKVFGSVGNILTIVKFATASIFVGNSVHKFSNDCAKCADGV